MKKMLLASIALLALVSTVHAQDIEDGMLTPKQEKYMRFHGVALNLINVDHPMNWRPSKFTRRGTVDYEAALINPYDRPIRCNINLTSSRGVNEDYEVIASKSHIGVYAAARSVTKVTGSIQIKRGRGDDGLQWVESMGNLVNASNCFFID